MKDFFTKEILSFIILILTYKQHKVRIIKMSVNSLRIDFMIVIYYVMIDSIFNLVDIIAKINFNLNMRALMVFDSLFLYFYIISI